MKLLQLCIVTFSLTVSVMGTESIRGGLKYFQILNPSPNSNNKKNQPNPNPYPFTKPQPNPNPSSTTWELAKPRTNYV
jgi:hypothetical protein